MAPGTCAGDTHSNTTSPKPRLLFSSPTPRRRRKTKLIRGIPNYSQDASPKQILKEAEAMPLEEARQYLLRHVRFHWALDTAIREIAEDPHLRLSLRRYKALAADLTTFSYYQWMLVVEKERVMRESVRAGNSRQAHLDTQVPTLAWDIPRDQRRVQAWLDQAHWNCWVFMTEAASKTAPTAK